MKALIAASIIILFAIGCGLLRWPRRGFKAIVADFSWTDGVGFTLLIVSVMMIGWARSV
jgi:hypothetical protein